MEHPLAKNGTRRENDPPEPSLTSTAIEDGASVRFTCGPEANTYLTREYRTGWLLVACCAGSPGVTAQTGTIEAEVER